MLSVSIRDVIGRANALIVHVDFHTFPITRAGSNGRCNTIWYKAVFKGGVYDPRETVWAFGGAEERHVASLEGGTVVA